VHDYPLGGRPPVMTRIFEGSGGRRIIAVDGAPAARASPAALTVDQQQQWGNAWRQCALRGFGVRPVGESTLAAVAYRADQSTLPVTILGLVAFYDPPKPNISEVFNAFYDAGIKVKIVTGDNAVTTATIARQVNFRGADQTLDGKELALLSDDALTT